MRGEEEGKRKGELGGSGTGRTKLEREKREGWMGVVCDCERTMKRKRKRQGGRGGFYMSKVEKWRDGPRWTLVELGPPFLSSCSVVNNRNTFLFPPDVVRDHWLYI